MTDQNVSPIVVERWESGSGALVFLLRLARGWYVEARSPSGRMMHSICIDPDRPVSEEVARERYSLAVAYCLKGEVPL